MKPKKIRVTTDQLCQVIKGEIINVEKWNDTGEHPFGKPKHRRPCYFFKGEWEPVSEFNHGDPVWAWDDDEVPKIEAYYVAPSVIDKEYVHVIEKDDRFGGSITDQYEFVEHRKPTMTLQELADKADVNLDEVEIVD